MAASIRRTSASATFRLMRSRGQRRVGRGVRLESYPQRHQHVLDAGVGGVEVALEVPVIKQMLNGRVQVSAESDSSGTVTYEGDKYLTFGFECFEVGVEEGVLTMMSAKAGSVALSGEAAAARAEPVLLDPVGLLDLDS